LKISHYTDIEELSVSEGSSKLSVRWLITKDLGATNFAMRLFEADPGGGSPIHSHPWEHEIFVLEGEGTVVAGNEEKKFEPGSFIFIPANEKHQMRATGDTTLKFLCVIPYKKPYLLRQTTNPL
jgi:quercetin dioxygenase-like cupin family protein